MSLEKLTEDLSNFKWTSYEKAGEGKSPQQDGTNYFERPNPKSLEGMETKFGPIDTQPLSRGPYGVSNVMDGEKQGRGFIPPGSTPAGFTKDMDLLHNPSEFEIGGNLTRTPLSYEIAGVVSDLSYGEVSNKSLNIEPAAKGAYGVSSLPISTYTNRQPIEGIPFGVVGGNNTYYGNIDLIASRRSKFQKPDGSYTTPTSEEITRPGSSTDFPSFEGVQRTFLIPDGYPFNNFAYSIDSQYGWTYQSKYLESHGTPWRGFKLRETLEDQFREGGGGGGTFPSFYPDLPSGQTSEKETQHPSKTFYISSEPNYSAQSYLELQFLLSYGNSNGIWPYGVLDYTTPNSTGPYGTFNDHPLIQKDIGQRYSVGGPIENWMALQATRTAEDTSRITKWLETPKGGLWITKQHILQNLNPREETRGFSVGNITLSLPPFIHAARHTGGSTYMEQADFGPLYDGDSPAPAFDPSSVGSLGDLASTELNVIHESLKQKSPNYAKLTGNFSTGKDNLDKFLSKLSDVNTALGAIDFNALAPGGRLRFLRDKMIAGVEDAGVFKLGNIGSINLTDMRNGTAPFGRTPKLPTQVVYSQRGPFGEKSTADTMNFKSPIKRYQSTTYGDIDKKPRPYSSLSPTSAENSLTDPGQNPFTHHDIPVGGPGIRKFGVDGGIMIPKQLTLAQQKENELFFDFDKMDENLQRGKDRMETQHQENVKNVGRLTSLGDPGRLRNSFTLKSDGIYGDPNIKDGQSGLGMIQTDLTDPKGYRSMGVDKVNATPYGLELGDNYKDFIKFKFHDVVNNKPLIFRAILSGISDSVTPEWSGTRYVGRPDQVYIYQGAERKLNFNFEIYPKTKQEFPVLLEKLNYLVGLCYPTYTENHRMIAPFMNLTIGDMFKNSPGFLDSLSIEVNDTSTWEMQEGLQFPKHITCTCSFTYIGRYQPSTLGKHYELNWLQDNGYDTKNGVAGTFKIGEGGTIRDTIQPDRQGSMVNLFDQFGGDGKEPFHDQDPFGLPGVNMNLEGTGGDTTLRG